MNKNPSRPKKIDKIISQILNPKETEKQRHARIKREVLKSIYD
jgi:hypothetical protein